MKRWNGLLILLMAAVLLAMDLASAPVSVSPAADEKTLDEALKRLPAAERHYADGLKAYRAGDYESAAAAFGKSVRELPGHAYARYYLANILYIGGDYEGALAQMEEALVRLPFMEELNAYAFKKRSRTIDSYQHMLNAANENITNCRQSRELESMVGELTDKENRMALQAGAELVRRSRQKAHYHYFLGNILFQLKRFGEAEGRYLEAIELDPGHVNAYNNAAAVAFLAGKPLEALGLLEKAEAQGLEDNLNLKLRHLVSEALGRPTDGILQEDLSSTTEEDLGVRRFALAVKRENPLLPPLYENCYVVFSRSSRQAVLIDPGAEDPRIEDFVKAENLEVRAILITHSHTDHTGAAAAYAKMFRAPVCVPVRDAGDLGFAADKRLGDGESLPFDGFTVRVLHTPGHTPGSACFIVGSILFSGDTLFRNGIGSVQPARPDAAKTAQKEMVGLIKRRLLALADGTRVCPGHGRTSTIGEERANNPFLAK
ncbi:MAG: MBL fold metallo-hydrolase [Candidatus Aminicenantes bacterium]|nr:MBL fold metallo-hydrolase [Candidatus Aminicenantes bacterium]